MNPAIMPVLNLLIDLFRRRRFLKREVLPLVEGVSGLPDHGERRKLVIDVLVARGLGESEARLLTEMGVRLWKKREAKRLKKAAKLAARGKV